MLVVFVRRSSEDQAEAVVPAEAAARGDVEVSPSAEGPFVPLAEAPSSPALRDRFARSLDVASVRRWRRARPWLLLGLFPVIALADLERELIALGTTGVGGRLFGDLVLTAFLVLEIARPIPRHRRTWILASLAIAARYAYMIAALCGRALPLFWLGVVLSSLAALAAYLTMPSPRALEAEVRAALKVAPPPPPPREKSRVALALVAAVALPALLFATRALGGGLAAQAFVFVGLGSALPFVVQREKAPARPWLARVDGAMFGLSAAIALVRCVHYTTITLAEALRCRAPEAYESIARRFLDAQAAEVGHRPPPGGAALVAAIVAVVVVPVVEERLYRGTLQRALRARTSSSKAIAAASAVFGLAHLGVYRAALHQTFLLGVAFGATYEEAGLAAAIAAHAMYNAAQLI